MFSIKAAFLLSLLLTSGLETMDAKRLNHEKLKQGLGLENEVASDSTDEDAKDEAQAEEVAADSTEEEAKEEAQEVTADSTERKANEEVKSKDSLALQSGPVWEQLASVGTVGIAIWLCRAIRQIATVGILPSRAFRDAKKVGRTICLDRTPVQSHYVIFSKKGEWGRGEINPKRLVVYLHGLAGHAGHLTLGVDGGLARSLVDADYSVLGLDIHGHGFSEAPDCSMEPASFVAQLVALLSHLGVTDPFDLIGFSHGCFLALAYAAEHPSSVKRLALTSPFGCSLPLHNWSVVAALYAFVVHLTFEENLSQMRTVYRIVMSLEGNKIQSLLHKIKSADMDVLVVAGSYEWIAPLNILTTARQITGTIPKSRLQLLPRASHMSWATGTPEQQKQFRRMIVDFLESSSTRQDANEEVAADSTDEEPPRW